MLPPLLYIRITREIHRIMGSFLSREFAAIEGLRVTMPEGSFYFFVDFNDIRDDVHKLIPADLVTDNSEISGHTNIEHA